MFFYFLLQIISARGSLEDLYLVPPYVDGKGKSNVVNFLGDFSILSYGGNRHIKLGFIYPDTRGAIVYRNQVGTDKFVIDTKVNLNAVSKGQENNGMLIFFNKTDNVEFGSMYGIKLDTEFAVALDIKKGLEVVIKIFINNKEDSSKTFQFYENDDVKIRIEQNDILKVEVDDNYDKLVVYESDKFMISKRTFLGVSASNGSESSTSFSLRSIEASYPIVIPKIFKRGEREGSSKMVWIVFLGSVCGLVYYLYGLQIRKNE